MVKALLITLFLKKEMIFFNSHYQLVMNHMIETLMVKLINRNAIQSYFQDIMVQIMFNIFLIAYLIVHVMHLMMELINQNKI